MEIEDYPAVYELWMSIKNFAIRSLDDSEDGIIRFILRNQGLSVVAVDNERIIGTILCGHDGRRGSFYHVCVAESYRNHGIGKSMAAFALNALREEGINKVNLIAFASNELGNNFWKSIGWTFRDDINYYELTLNESNNTEYVK